MEDKIITSTPAAFQMLFMIWIGFDNLRLYAADGRFGRLFLGLVAWAILPFVARRFLKAWHQVAESDLAG
jgi:hypothetical protein